MIDHAPAQAMGHHGRVWARLTTQNAHLPRPAMAKSAQSSVSLPAASISGKSRLVHRALIAAPAQRARIGRLVGHRRSACRAQSQCGCCDASSMRWRADNWRGSRTVV